MPTQNSTSDGPFGTGEETRVVGSASDQPTIAGPPPTTTSSLPPNLAALAQRYEMLGKLGRGAMGQVYKARDRETGEIVALKLINPEISSDQEMIESFKKELAFARKITHKNVCRVYEFNRVGDIAYTSMEFVEGENLRSVLKRFGSVSPRKGMDLALQMCSGLKEAHSQGIVHRDLKPENVMIDSKGNLKIMDFGIARSMETMTRATGAVTGTPAYMAPEQALGKQVDYRTDVYALGLIFYEMFTGTRAFSADNSVALALKQLNELPVPPREIEPSISIALNQSILKCLEREPEKRFQSVSDLEKSLLNPGRAPAAEISPAVSSEATSVSKPANPPKQKRIVPVLISLGVIFGLATIFVWRSTTRKNTQSTVPARVVIPETTASGPPIVAAPMEPPPKPHTPGIRAESIHDKSFQGEKSPTRVNRSSSKIIAKQEMLNSEPASGSASNLQPYILVGRFGRTAVAHEAAKKVEAMGLPSVVLPRHNPTTDKDFFAVFSGPFAQNEVDDAMQKLQAGGFSNIIAVKGLGPVKQAFKP